MPSNNNRSNNAAAAPVAPAGKGSAGKGSAGKGSAGKGSANPAAQESAAASELTVAVNGGSAKHASALPTNSVCGSRTIQAAAGNDETQPAESPDKLEAIVTTAADAADRRALDAVSATAPPQGQSGTNNDTKNLVNTTTNLTAQSSAMLAKLQQKRAMVAASLLVIESTMSDQSLVGDFVTKAVAVGPLKLKHMSPLGLVQIDNDGAGLLCFAEHSTLFLAIIDPHDGAKPPDAMIREGKLSLLAGAKEDTETVFSVYSISFADSHRDCAAAAAVAATFAVSALCRHKFADATSLTAHQLLISHHFLQECRIPMGEENSKQNIRIAASTDDFGYLSRRFVDYRGEHSLLSSANLIDFASHDIWDERTEITLLIGGESGSGKTWAMITNFFVRSHLTVYIRLHNSLSVSELNSLDDTDTRNSRFCSYAATAVKNAINRVCPALDSKLMACDDPEPFYVRICFDEIGGSPTLTRACCAKDSAKSLHTALGWNERVVVRLFAGGTGVGAVNNLGGSENSCFKLIILGASRGCDLYWMYRFHNLSLQVDSVPDTPLADAPAQTKAEKELNEKIKKKNALFQKRLAEVRDSVNAVRQNWSAGPTERAKALRARDAALWNAFELAHTFGLLNRKLGGFGRQKLIPEAIFAAVESDSACAHVLSNPRLAALILSRCAVVTTQALQSRASARTITPNIRHDVLQPVANRFTSLNGLEDVTASMACDLVVESFRYVIFDGYESADKEHGASMLMARRGVLVDNANFVPVEHFDQKLHVEVTLINDTPPAAPTKSATYARTDASTSPAAPTKSGETQRTHIARYLKAVGRFSISPAMVVVLSHLMSSAFQENFSNIGDVFERALAKFLYFATLVFHGRPVIELVKFIVAPLAIIGAKALAVLRSAGNVAFDTLELRISGALNANHLESTNPQRLAAARRQFTKLWSNVKPGGSGVRAWIEVSPASLPSADVVLHIPGVITLPFQCKDTGISMDLDKFNTKLGNSLWAMNGATSNYAKKLRGLQAQVVPIFYMTRARNMTDIEIASTSQVVGRNGILAMGIGEPVLTIPTNYTQIHDHQRASWLHQTRRNMMLFDFRREEPEDAEVVAGPHVARTNIGSSDARAPSIENQWIATV
ncbi:Hypothetical protein, putative [Bodo saltans]|uniref:Uncharacterized protein n=1 Tax=Bodo saltans TaxID=75058 RepID=A0A0S4J149_BODSA|nr:Hypothetical protein, putative [Bodo saltans]|eukprot:CUG40019.1 Hypothetical protein, putative [Bodo saltans]